MKHRVERKTFQLEQSESERLWQTISAPVRNGELPPDGGESGGLARWLEEWRPFLTTGLVLAVSLLIVVGTLRTFLADRDARLAELPNAVSSPRRSDADWTTLIRNQPLTIVFEGVDETGTMPQVPLPPDAAQMAPRPPARLSLVVHDAESGESLQHASVLLANVDDSLITPLLADGHPRSIAPGRGQKLYLSHLGYAARETTLDVLEGEDLRLDLGLPPVIVGTLNTFDVEGDAYAPPTPPGAPATELPPFAPSRGSRASDGSGRQSDSTLELQPRSDRDSGDPDSQTGALRPPSPPAPRAPALGLPRAATAVATNIYADRAPDPGYPAETSDTGETAFHVEGAPSPDRSESYLVRIGVQDPAASTGPVSVDFLEEHVTAWRRVDLPGARGTTPRAGDDRLTAGSEDGDGYRTGLYEIEIAAGTLTDGAAPVTLAWVRRVVADGRQEAPWSVTTADLTETFATAPTRFRLACLGALLAEDLREESAPAERATSRLNSAEELARELDRDADVDRVRAWLARCREEIDRRD